MEGAAAGQFLPAADDRIDITGVELQPTAAPAGALGGDHRRAAAEKAVEHDDLPLTLVPLKDEPGAARMEYHIAMGVRANEPEWRRRINAAILKRQGDMTAILRDYGVPLLNEQGELAGP